MNKSEILSKVTEVVRDQLDSDDVVLRNDTISSEVEGWDSLAHVRIMIAIEQSMGISR